MKKYTLIKIFIVSLTILIFANCSKRKSNKKENINRIKLLNNYDKTLKFEDVYDTTSYRFIPLETNDNSVFGLIDKVFIDDERIFVIDRGIAKQAFIFDINGKFITKIGKKGNGPNEFMNIQGMTIDKKQKNIILLDLSQWKLLYYDYNGVFVRAVKFNKYPGMSVSHIAENLIASYSHVVKENQSNQLLFFNNEGNIVSKHYPLQNKKFRFVMPCKYFSENDNGVFCIPIFYDKICKIDKKGNISEVFDFGIADLMVNDEDKERYKETVELFKLKKFHYFNYLKVNNSGIFVCNNNYNNEVVTTIGNLNNGEMVVGKLEITHDDSNKLGSPNFIIGTWGDYFISYFHPYFFQFRKECAGARETDNMGILLFKLKENCTSDNSKK